MNKKPSKRKKRGTKNGEVQSRSQTREHQEHSKRRSKKDRCEPDIESNSPDRSNVIGFKLHSFDKAIMAQMPIIYPLKKKQEKTNKKN